MSEVTCNLCGLSCDLPAGPTDDPKPDPHGLIEEIVAGHYASTPGDGHGALDDCTTYEFSMCEFCLDWLFQQFKLPPKVRKITVDGAVLSEERWRSASQRVAEDEWRRFGDEFKIESMKRSSARARIFR